MLVWWQFWAMLWANSRPLIDNCYSNVWTGCNVYGRLCMELLICGQGNVIHWWIVMISRAHVLTHASCVWSPANVFMMHLCSFFQGSTDQTTIGHQCGQLMSIKQWPLATSRFRRQYILMNALHDHPCIASIFNMIDDLLHAIWFSTGFPNRLSKNALHGLFPYKVHIDHVSM